MIMLTAAHIHKHNHIKIQTNIDTNIGVFICCKHLRLKRQVDQTEYVFNPPSKTVFFVPMQYTQIVNFLQSWGCQEIFFNILKLP